MSSLLLLRKTAVSLLIIAGFASVRDAPPPPPQLSAVNACDGRRFVAPPGVTASTTLAGKLLVASDAMPDPTFVGTRIYLLEHDVAGAVGVIVNRPIAGHDVPFALHDGGPVGKDVVLLVHSDDYKTPDTLLIEPGVAVTTRSSAIDDMRSGHGPERWLLAWGYSGWGPGQLEREQAAGVWRVEEAGAEVLPER